MRQKVNKTKQNTQRKIQKPLTTTRTITYVHILTIIIWIKNYK